MNHLSELLSLHDKKIAMLLSLFLVGLISLSLANSVWFFMEHLSGTDEVSSIPQKTPTRSKSKTDISKLNIFGKAQKTAVKRDISNVPKTSLNLELQGIFAAEDTRASRALISQKGKAGELYKVGQKLPGNATLDSVFETYVLIKRGARIEKLAFSENSLKAGKNTLASGLNRQINSSPRNTTSRLQNVRERIENRGKVRVPNDKKYQTADLQQSLNAYQNRLNSEPDAVLSELGMTAIESGEAKGYRIGSEISTPLLQKSGLQQGDVILSVNGKAVGDVQNDQGLINQVVASKRARVEVQRGSRKFYVTVPIPD